jgi:hypothetical protein
VVKSLVASKKLDTIAPTPACINGSAVRAAYKRSLRTGSYWRLSPEERAILRLSYSFPLVRSPTLALTFSRITARVLPSLARRVQALTLGMRVVEQRARQALSLGYYQALEWLKDISYGGSRSPTHRKRTGPRSREHEAEAFDSPKTSQLETHGKSDGNPSKPIT